MSHNTDSYSDLIAILVVTVCDLHKHILVFSTNRTPLFKVDCNYIFVMLYLSALFIIVYSKGRVFSLESVDSL